MKTPEGPGYVVDTRDRDGMIERAVECLDCGSNAVGFNHWLGGIVDEPTHILLLRQRLGAQCRRADCPQPKEASFHG